MHSKFGLTGVSTLLVLATLSACGGGGGGGGGSAAVPPLAPKVWGRASLIETDAGDAGSSQVAIDVNGNALAVWTQSDGTRNNIWANRYQ